VNWKPSRFWGVFPFELSDEAFQTFVLLIFVLIALSVLLMVGDTVVLDYLRSK